MHRSTLPSATAIVSVILAVLCSVVLPAHAQFNPSALKKKAEQAVSTTASGQEAVAAPEGESPEETINKAAQAVRPILDMRSVYPGMYAQKREAQQFHDNCRDIDYSGQRARVQQAVAMKPDAREREEFSYNQVMTEFPKHFASLKEEYLIKEINSAIETAYAEKGKGASRAGAAVEAAESAMLVCEGILFITPDDAQVQGLKADAEAALAAMGAAREKVYTGSFHKEHAGKIVFSSQPIVAGEENPAALRETFSAATDDIYGMMYFTGTFKEVTNGSGYGWTRLFVDGNEKAAYNFKLPADQAENAWLKSEIIPDPAASSTRGAAIFTKALSELSPRRHTVSVRTFDDLGKVVAEGEFTLDCSGGLDRVANVHRRINEQKLAKVKLPEPAMRNAALEKECMAALKDWKETPIKVIFTDADWTIQYHPVTGAITSRTINTTVAVKKPDGGCRMFVISFRQQYQGKKYGKAQQYGVGDSADIPCDNVK